jgi:hypothetical protein
VASSRSSSASSSPDPYLGAWQRVEHAILEAPGRLNADARRAIMRGSDPAELAPLLAKVRRRAYAITDDDVGGVDPDVVLEATLAAAFAEADRRRVDALRAIG